MAAYKVPQDVEAEDKLIGPFGFRQFAYLMIAGFCIFLSYLLFRIHPAMALLPLPVIGLFLLVALPLRKDQPMEIYLLALLRFYMKPKRRLWNPDGTITYVEITVPKVNEDELPTKGLTQEAAEQRLDYLARVMDSRGWSIKGVVSQNANTNVTPTVAAESYGVTDIMDERADVARSFDDLLAKKNAENRQNAISRMRQPAEAAPAPARPRFARNPYDDVLARQFTGQAQTLPQGSTQPQTQPVLGTPWLDVAGKRASAANPAPAGQTAPAPAVVSADLSGAAPKFNPYPAAMHQKVINPDDQNGTQQNAVLTTMPGNTPPASAPATPAASQQPAQNPMPQPVPPDIIRLAGNPDLSISAMAHEARRIIQNEEGKDEDEVFIKLH